MRCPDRERVHERSIVCFRNPHECPRLPQAILGKSPVRRRRTCSEGPFGELLHAEGGMALLNPFRFSTKYQDDETGVLYYGYRYYDPSTGRCLYRGPIGDTSGLNPHGRTASEPLVGFEQDDLTARQKDLLSGAYPIPGRGSQPMPPLPPLSASSGVYYVEIPSWHPGAGWLGTIECRGGKFSVVNKNPNKTDGGCTKIHEDSHIRDYIARFGANACAGVPDGWIPQARRQVLLTGRSSCARASAARTLPR